MGGKDASDSTNLELVKVGRSGKVAIAGEDDDKNKDAAAFKRLMVKMQEEAKPVGFLHGRGDLDHDDILYLREQSQAEEDANRQRELNERRAFAAFKLVPCFSALFATHAAASAADSPTASASTAAVGSSSSSVVSSPKVHVQPKQKKGIRQSALISNIVAIVKPKKQPGGLSRSSSGGREDSGKRPKIGNDDRSSISGSTSLASSLDKAPSSTLLPGLVTSLETEVTCSSRDEARTEGANQPAGEGVKTRSHNGPSDGASRIGRAADDAVREATRATSNSDSAPGPKGALMGLHESASQCSLLGLAYDDSDEE